MVDGMAGESEIRVDQRWRVAIYGDVLSMEHAKARVLCQIDSMVCTNQAFYYQSTGS